MKLDDAEIGAALRAVRENWPVGSTNLAHALGWADETAREALVELYDGGFLRRVETRTRSKAWLYAPAGVRMR